MATINSSAIFPSIKFIETDSLGDIQEVVGTNASASSLSFQNLTFTAVDAGVDGDDITIEIQQGQAGAGVVGIEVSVSESAITIRSENALGTYTEGELKTAVDGNTDASALVSVSVTNANDLLTNGSITATNLANGADATAGELDASAEYILIKKTDLHDLESGENDDGRKLIWGIVHQASEAFASLTDAPENFTITRGNPVSVNSGANVRQTYTIQATYSLEGLDLQAEG